MKARLGLVAIAVALGALSGCGSDDEGDAGQVVEEYLDAVGERDYAEACKFLAASAKSALGGDCAKTLEQRYDNLTSGARDDFDDIDVSAVDVSGDKATIRPAGVRVERTSTRKVKGKKKTTTTYDTAQDVTNGAGFTLTKSGGDWLISSGI